MRLARGERGIAVLEDGKYQSKDVVCVWTRHSAREVLGGYHTPNQYRVVHIMDLGEQEGIQWSCEWVVISLVKSGSVFILMELGPLPCFRVHRKGLSTFMHTNLLSGEPLIQR